MRAAQTKALLRTVGPPNVGNHAPRRGLATAIRTSEMGRRNVAGGRLRTKIARENSRLRTYFVRLAGSPRKVVSAYAG